MHYCSWRSLRPSSLPPARPLACLPAGLGALSSLRHLASLCLWNCLRLSEAGLQRTLSSLTALSALSLRGCQQIGDGGLGACRPLSALRRLDMRACESLRGGPGMGWEQGRGALGLDGREVVARGVPQASVGWHDWHSIVHSLTTPNMRPLESGRILGGPLEDAD